MEQGNPRAQGIALNSSNDRSEQYHDIAEHELAASVARKWPVLSRIWDEFQGPTGRESHSFTAQPVASSVAPSAVDPSAPNVPENAQEQAGAMPLASPRKGPQQSSEDLQALVQRLKQK